MLGALAYWRTALYLAAAAVIWCAEDVLFTRALGFGTVQIAVVSAYFVLLFATAILMTVHFYRHSTAGKPAARAALPATRLVAAVPVLVVILGSFLALPVILFTLLVGAWL
jgi:hypothetical protein